MHIDQLRDDDFKMVDRVEIEDLHDINRRGILDLAGVIITPPGRPAWSARSISVAMDMSDDQHWNRLHQVLKGSERWNDGRESDLERLRSSLP